jgi:hypothetical protein
VQAGRDRCGGVIIRAIAIEVPPEKDHLSMLLSDNGVVGKERADGYDRVSADLEPGRILYYDD